jgi:lysophospholipase L1-like esterase
MKRTLIILNIFLTAIIVWLVIEGSFVKRTGEFIVKAFDIRDNYSYEMNQNYGPESEKFILYDKQADIVMLGNSITAQTDWNELLNRSDVVNRGISGDITEGMLRRMDSVLKVKPKICFFMGGINDISRRISYEKTVSNIKAIADVLKSNGIKPVIQSVLYTGERFYGYEDNNPVVAQLNAELKKICAESGIEYIDINSILSLNGLLRSEFTHDGLHLNAKGYKEWSLAIISVLDSFENAKSE